MFVGEADENIVSPACVDINFLAQWIYISEKNFGNTKYWGQIAFQESF